MHQSKTSVNRVLVLTLENKCFPIRQQTSGMISLMHLSAAIPGVTPGTYGGIVQDLLAFVANVWPGTGALDRFCTSKARYTGKDPQDL